MVTVPPAAIVLPALLRDAESWAGSFREAAPREEGTPMARCRGDSPGHCPQLLLLDYAGLFRILVAVPVSRKPLSASGACERGD